MARKPKEIVYYFESYDNARKWAESNAWPTDRIIEYERGWAVQLHVSGPYAGPNQEQPQHHKCAFCPRS